MDRVVVCLDCQHYQKGGSCRKTGKDVGALQEACDKAHEPFDRMDMIKPVKPKPEPVPEGHKRCSRCGEVKPLDNFGTNRINKDGKQAWCKECTRLHAQKKRKTPKEPQAQPEKKKAEEKPAKKKPSKPKTKPMKKTEKPTPAPVLNEGIATVKTGPVNPFSTFKDHELADELRARGYEVKAEKTVTIQL